MKLFLFLTVLVAIPAMSQEGPRWNPQQQSVWDPNRLFNTTQIVELENFAKKAPIRTYIIIFQDLSLKSIGPKWYKEATKKKPGEKDYFPAGAVMREIEKTYGLGEGDKTGQSLVVLFTSIRDDPKKRWNFSLTEPTGHNISKNQALVDQSLLTFVRTMDNKYVNRISDPSQFVIAIEKSIEVFYQKIPKKK
jgi:hypothetical protein